MYVTKAVLDDIHSAADSLRTTIESMTHKIASINTAGGFTNTLIHWGWLSLILIALYQINARFAGLAATGIAAVVLFTISFYPWLLSVMQTDITLVHYASGLRVPLATLILVAAVCSMLGLTILFYRVYSRRTYFYHRISDLGSELPLARRFHDHHFNNQPYDIDDRIRSSYENYAT